jgi:hypothetical protein
MTLTSRLSQTFQTTVWIGRNAISIQQEGAEGEPAGAVIQMEKSPNKEALDCRLKVSCKLPGIFTSLGSLLECRVVLLQSHATLNPNADQSILP